MVIVAASDYTLSGYNKNLKGNQTVTVTYQGKKAEFIVDVTDPKLPTAAKPTASQAAGAVASGTAVTLETTTTGAEIWYTTNGTTPQKGGTGNTKYTNPITITAAVTIKAIAFKDGMNDSEELAVSYTITDPNLPTAAKPTASQAAGAVASGTAVTLATATYGAEIWYTTNGTTPQKGGTVSNKYTTPITITVAVTIKAIAFKDGMNDSEELAVSYTIAGGITPDPEIFTASSIVALEAWLTSQPDNTAGDPYKIKLNVGDLGDRYIDNNLFDGVENPESLGYLLNNNDNKKVSLDLSGSTFTSIGDVAFRDCTNLTSVIIPNSVTSIGWNAFWKCTSLTSVTFAAGSNIADADFGDYNFPERSEGYGGDTLKTAYSTGKAGTYTRPVDGDTWSKR